MNGYEAKIDNKTGELLLRGRNVCMGYLGLEEKTKYSQISIQQYLFCHYRETIDEEGWLHTGDMAELVTSPKWPGEFIRVTGRLKELIVTAGGKNVAPLPLEEAIKAKVQSNVITIVITLINIDFELLIFYYGTWNISPDSGRFQRNGVGRPAKASVRADHLQKPSGSRLKFITAIEHLFALKLIQSTLGKLICTKISFPFPFYCIESNFQ